MKKVIYISYQKLRDQFKEDFFINNLIDEKIEFEYWDLSEMFSRKFEMFQPEYVVPIINKIELIKRIKENNLKSTAFIIHITYDGTSLKLFRIFTKLNCFIVYISRQPLVNFLPTTIIKLISYRINFQTFKLLWKPRKISKIIKNYIALFYKQSGLIKPYDIVFCAGAKGIKFTGVGWQKDLEKSKVIAVNSVEYEKSKKNDSNLSNTIKEEYAVFLDQYLPFHPDINIIGNNSLDPNEYYNDLNKFFKKIEDNFSLKVIIASHPKAEKYNEFNFFENRRVLFDATKELVKGCKFVVAHWSTSINYAIIFDKPIIFLLSDQIKKTWPTSYLYTIQLGQLLSQNTYNLNENYFNFKINKLSNNTRIKFIEDYIISSNSSNYNSSEIFIKVIKLS